MRRIHLWAVAAIAGFALVVMPAVTAAAPDATDSAITGEESDPSGNP